MGSPTEGELMETLAVETTHHGKLFNVEVLRLRDGHGAEYRREVVRHPGAVAIVALLEPPPEHGDRPARLLMIRNYRVAVGQSLWEVPAGKLEPGEPPPEAAGRELEEETGYRPGRVEPLGRFYTSPGFADELMHVFVATDLEPVGQRLEPGEHIEVEALEIPRALEMIRDGTVMDGKTIAAILMWRQRCGGSRP